MAYALGYAFRTVAQTRNLCAGVCAAKLYQKTYFLTVGCALGYALRTVAQKRKPQYQTRQKNILGGFDGSPYGFRPTKTNEFSRIVHAGVGAGRAARKATCWPRRRACRSKSMPKKNKTCCCMRLVFQTCPNRKILVMAGNTFLTAVNTLVMAVNTLAMAANTFVMAGSPEVFRDQLSLKKRPS